MPIETKPAGDHRPQIVTAAGAVTTLVAFAIVFALAKRGTNIMGWYANWILPAGALLVGAVAASGYAIAAWYTGFKMTMRFMWSVVGQLVLSYFIAQYESYQLMVPSGLIGFWRWFDLSTQAFSFSANNPLGAVGYIFRVLEIAGFVGGGVIVPLALSSKPYCDPCRTYKRTKALAVIPGTPQPTMSDGPYADPVTATVQGVYTAASAHDRETFKKLIGEYASNHRAARKDGAFTTISLARCPRCAQGELAARATVHEGGNNWRHTDLGGYKLTGDSVRQLVD